MCYEFSAYTILSDWCFFFLNAVLFYCRSSNEVEPMSERTHQAQEKDEEYQPCGEHSKKTIKE